MDRRKSTKFYLNSSGVSHNNNSIEENESDVPSKDNKSKG